MLYEYPILTHPLTAYKNRREWLIGMVKRLVESLTAGASGSTLEKTTYWQKDNACRSVCLSSSQEPDYQCWIFCYTDRDPKPEGFDHGEWGHFIAHVKKFWREEGGQTIITLYQYGTSGAPYVIWPFEAEVPS